jgi:hypothetical protein
MQTVTKIIIFDSANQNAKISTKGAELSINIKGGLNIPYAAENIESCCVSSVIWNRFNNISELKQNNKFKFSSDSGTTWLTVTLQNGQYTLDTLQDTIDDLLFLNGYSKGTVTFTGDYSTNYVTILTDSGNMIDFSESVKSFKKIIGFDPQIITSVSSIFPVQSNFQADFRPLSNIKIASEIGKLVLNGSIESILSYYSLQSQAGFQDTYAPTNLIWCDSNHLKGTSITNTVMTIKNELDDEVEIDKGDPFAVTVMIRYEIPRRNDPLNELINKISQLLNKLI